VETATGMGMAVTFVMTVASAICWLFQRFLLDALNIGFMQTTLYILVIAFLVQLVEMVLQKTSPALYQALGIYLPLITTNCAVLGVALINFNEGYNFIEAVVNGFAAALGFSIVIIIFAGIRERMAIAEIPKSLQGFSIALLTASLLSISFFGFQGFNLAKIFGL
jgi:electron transport complex protein RnfA